MKHLHKTSLRKLLVASVICLAPLLRAQEETTGPAGGSFEATEPSGEEAVVVVDTEADGSVVIEEEVGVALDADGEVVELIEALEIDPVEDETVVEIPAPPATPQLRPSQTRRSFAEDVVRIFSNGMVGPEEAAGDFVVVIGDGTVEGQVQGDAVVILGDITVNGRINGDLVNVMGTTTLGPEAVINGELVVAGGKLVAAEGALVNGQTVEVSVLPNFGDGHFDWLSAWIHKGLLMGRPLPHDQTWAWITAGVFLLIGLIISLIFRRAIDATVAVLEGRPAAALLTGLLVFILAGPLFFLLVISVVGIFIIPFLGIAIKVAGVFGVIGVYRYSGQQLGLRSAPTAALLTGGIIFTLLYAVPVIGFLTLFLACLLGTGATLLALFQGIRKESSGSQSVGAPMSPISPTSPAPGHEPASKLTAPAGTIGTDPTALPRQTPIEPAAPMTGDSSDDPLMAERVGFWPRLGATALDFILVSLLISFTDLQWFMPFAWIGYHLVFWTWRQTTIGGIVMNLKIVRLDGQPLKFGVVAVRSLASIFSGMVVGLGFFWASWDEERQSWHDKIAGTTIVRVPKGTSLL